MIQLINRYKLLQRVMAMSDEPLHLLSKANRDSQESDYAHTSDDEV